MSDRLLHGISKGKKGAAGGAGFVFSAKGERKDGLVMPYPEGKSLLLTNHFRIIGLQGEKPLWKIRGIRNLCRKRNMTAL